MVGKKNHDVSHYTEEELEELSRKAQQGRMGPKDKRKLKERLYDSMDGIAATAAPQVERKYHPRWMKICGVDTPEQIDYDNPVVSTERFLCNPQVIRDLIQGRRDDVLAKMSETQR